MIDTNFGGGTAEAEPVPDKKAKNKDPVEDEAPQPVDPYAEQDEEYSVSLATNDTEANRTDVEQSKYLIHQETLIKLDLRYAYVLAVLDRRYELAKKILSTYADRERFLNPYHEYLFHFIMGWCSKEIFLQKLEEFQIIYELKYEMEGNHKYRQFYAHIPN